MTSIRIPPAVLTAGAALAIYTKTLPAYFGLVASLALLVLLLWIGYCHSMECGIGLQLVELEQKINSKLSLSESQGVSFYSQHLSSGMQKFPGFPIYTLLSFVVFLALFAFSLQHFWVAMDGWGWPTYGKVLGVVVPLILNLIPAITMCSSENATRRMKDTIRARYRAGQDMPNQSVQATP